MAESKSVTWQALNTAGAHHRLETQSNQMPFTQREIWESCQRLPRIVIFHLNLSHFPPSRQTSFSVIILAAYSSSPPIPVVETTGFSLDLHRDIICGYQQINVLSLCTCFKTRRFMWVGTERVSPKLPGYHQVPRPKEDGIRFYSTWP